MQSANRFCACFNCPNEEVKCESSYYHLFKVYMALASCLLWRAFDRYAIILRLEYILYISVNVDHFVPKIKMTPGDIATVLQGVSWREVRDASLCHPRIIDVRSTRSSLELGSRHIWIRFKAMQAFPRFTAIVATRTKSSEAMVATVSNLLSFLRYVLFARATKDKSFPGWGQPGGS